MQCETFKQSLRPYLEDTLDEEDRAQWRQHLLGCERCRHWAVADEPSLLFATVAPHTDPEAVESCVDNVTALIRQERIRRRLRPRSRPWLAAAAAVVLVAGGSGLWRFVSGDGAPVAPEAAANAGTATVAEEANQPPEVEVDMSGEGVRIYRFADDEDENTAVVFIVNPALES